MHARTGGGGEVEGTIRTILRPLSSCSNFLLLLIRTMIHDVAETLTRSNIMRNPSMTMTSITIMVAVLGNWSLVLSGLLDVVPFPSSVSFIALDSGMNECQY